MLLRGAMFWSAQPCHMINLPPESFERHEVWGCRVEDGGIASIGIIQHRDILGARKVELLVIPGGIAGDHCPKVADGDHERIDVTAPLILAAWLVAGPDLGTGRRVLQSGVDLFDGADFSSGEALAGVRCASSALDGRRIKVALARSVMSPSLAPSCASHAATAASSIILSFGVTVGGPGGPPRLT